jgi:hypothetical protein
MVLERQRNGPSAGGKLGPQSREDVPERRRHNFDVGPATRRSIKFGFRERWRMNKRAGTDLGRDGKLGQTQARGPSRGVVVHRDADNVLQHCPCIILKGRLSWRLLSTATASGCNPSTRSTLKETAPAGEAEAVGIFSMLCRLGMKRHG